MTDFKQKIQTRHDETLDFYTTEKLTERERNILRSEMTFLLSLLEDEELGTKVTDKVCECDKPQHKTPFMDESDWNYCKICNGHIVN